MKAQFKYSFRAHLTARSVALAAVLGLNLVFGLLGYFGAYGHGGKITAVVLSSLALFGILIVCFLTDYSLLHSMCSSPAGYLVALTPVKSWKILFARVVTILVEDMICLTAGIAGIVVQAFIMINFHEMAGAVRQASGLKVWWGVLIGLLGYLQMILFILLCVVLVKSLFFSRGAGTFLAILATIGTAYVFSLLNLVLTPFGVVDGWGMFYSISLNLGFNAGTIAYLVLDLCKSAALFVASAYLMERKINL